MTRLRFSRRDFARLSTAAAAVVAGHSPLRGASIGGAAVPALTEFGYGDVTVDSALHRAQLQNTHDVLMNLSEDSLLKPFRQMVGQPAPGDDLGDALRTLRGQHGARDVQHRAGCETHVFRWACLLLRGL